MGLDKFVDMCTKYLLSLHSARRRNFLITVRWVDDMVGTANTKETNDKVTEKLAAKYKIKGDW